MQRDPIKVHEHEGGGKSSALVSIDKWMILADVERICCRLLKEIRVQQCPFE